MMDFKFDEKCFDKSRGKKYKDVNVKKGLVRKITDRNKQINGSQLCTKDLSIYNILPISILSCILMGLLIYSIFNLQIVEGSKMFERSERNQIKLINIQPRRGIVFDRNGEKLVENKSVVDLYISLSEYVDALGEIDFQKIKRDIEKMEEALGDIWISDVEGEDFQYVMERIYVVLEKEPNTERIVLASDLDNETVITIKSLFSDFKGFDLQEGINREYIYSPYLTHILGYTSIVNADDFKDLDYIGFNDIVGRAGIERYYDEELFGQKGQIAIEVDALGKPVSDYELVVNDPIPGKSLYLTIDLEAQKKAYEILEAGVAEYGASSGTMILQDVDNGEILVKATFPSYDSNLFVRGITQDEFDSLLYADGSPLTNKAIAAQVPPGSIFKTIVAASFLDAGVINRNTTYLSKRGYTFTNGVPFQEYMNNAYGVLNVVDALMVSSNIYFCEVIRKWDIQKLVPYLEDFGVGSYTGIDIPGEGSGRLPSPENKVELAKTSSPWLEKYWLPEGDSCNSVIGQGITTATPIQAVTWASAIANGGVLNRPHLAKKVVDSSGTEDLLNFESINQDFISEESLKIVREGMYASVNGERRIVVPLSDAKVEVAAKTGTAEFGRLNRDGKYEHTHAWVIGFFPYEDPKYSFVVFLEDGGASNNSAHLARQFIDWFSDSL